ncbi:MAG: hypothetical protein J6N21_18225 [Butyrivibrio sp.]|nr:hypothetical protein [Butyrivibrio sp.]
MGVYYVLFLKKTNNRKGTYLQIYESYYDPERKCGAHRSYKPIGYVHELIAKGIDDPIAFYGEEVIPKLFENYNFSLDQLYSGLEYIGSEYDKIIEIYNHQLNQKYSFDTSNTYFDCANFYFEIDKEDDFRKKGPSKENKKEPIVGLGLLLDAHQCLLKVFMQPIMTSC